MSIKDMMSSENTCWQTPQWLIDSLPKITLDPCGAPNNPCHAEVNIYPPLGDGLLANWAEEAEGGLVYVNPPYGRQLLPWCQKIDAQAGAGALIITMVPARPDTEWWQTLTARCRWVLFFTSRIKFIDPAYSKEVGSPAFPSALVGHGLGVPAFVREHGHVFVPEKWTWK